MVYYYDSTFDGLMTAIFDIYSAKDNEAIIQPTTENVPFTLYGSHNVITNVAKSDRVQRDCASLARECLNSFTRLGFPTMMESRTLCCRLSGLAYLPGRTHLSSDLRSGM